MLLKQQVHVTSLGQQVTSRYLSSLFIYSFELLVSKLLVTSVSKLLVTSVSKLLVTSVSKLLVTSVNKSFSQSGTQNFFNFSKKVRGTETCHLDGLGWLWMCINICG